MSSSKLDEFDESTAVTPAMVTMSREGEEEEATGELCTLVAGLNSALLVFDPQSLCCSSAEGYVYPQEKTDPVVFSFTQTESSCCSQAGDGLYIITGVDGREVGHVHAEVAGLTQYVSPLMQVVDSNGVKLGGVNIKVPMMSNQYVRILDADGNEVMRIEKLSTGFFSTKFAIVDSETGDEIGLLDPSTGMLSDRVTCQIMFPNDCPAYLKVLLLFGSYSSQCYEIEKKRKGRYQDVQQ